MTDSQLSSQLNGAIEDLITSYHELNAGFVEELDAEPSPLEFMRYVAKNRPFVVRGGASSWPAMQKWDCSYLRSVMDGRLVNVAVTPHGNADSVVENPKDGLKYFVKPFEQDELFDHFLSYVQNQELNGYGGTTVKYAQTQNDNLRGEYRSLLADLEDDINWAHIALQQSPDAINLWIGNSRSVTALHRDNYENIYCQIIGQKHFVLMPPIEFACVVEELLPSATYSPKAIRVNQQSSNAAREADLEKLEVMIDDQGGTVPCATWDPDTPAKPRTNPLSLLGKPIRVTLEPGDMLYLPTLWYHKVSQTCGTEGICCAVNYWYDMDFGGSLHSLSAFVRNVSLAAASQSPQNP